MLDKHLIAKTEPAALQENMVEREGVRITVLGDRLFRIEQEPEGHFCDQATQTVWFRRFEQVSFSVSENQEASELKIATDSVALVWKGSIEESFVVFAGQEKKSFLNNSENLLGTYRTLDCCDGDQFISFDSDGQPSEKIQLGYGVVSRNGVALLDRKSVV